MAYRVIVDKGDVDFGAGFDIPFLAVEGEHFPSEFFRVFLTSMDSYIDGFRQRRAVSGKCVAVGVHNHAFFIHQHAAVIHRRRRCYNAQHQ